MRIGEDRKVLDHITFVSLFSMLMSMTRGSKRLITCVERQVIELKDSHFLFFDRCQHFMIQKHMDELSFSMKLRSVNTVLWLAMAMILLCWNYPMLQSIVSVSLRYIQSYFPRSHCSNPLIDIVPVAADAWLNLSSGRCLKKSNDSWPYNSGRFTAIHKLSMFQYAFVFTLAIHLWTDTTRNKVDWKSMAAFTA